MFKKKPKEQPVEEKMVEEKSKEKEPIIKHVPNVETAWIVIRDNINHWIMGLCNLSKQEKTDISTCMDYLFDYIRAHYEMDSIKEQINNEEIQNYSKSFEKNGYVVTIDIKKKK